MWGWLAENLPPATWVMCGDFNMVEVASHKDDFFSFRWTAGEREPWYYMHNKLDLFDPNINHYQDSRVWHTWSNFRAGSDHILKHLDHAMITALFFFLF